MNTLDMQDQLDRVGRKLQVLCLAMDSIDRAIAGEALSGIMDGLYETQEMVQGVSAGLTSMRPMQE